MWYILVYKSKVHYIPDFFRVFTIIRVSTYGMWRLDVVGVSSWRTDTTEGDLVKDGCRGLDGDGPVDGYRGTVGDVSITKYVECVIFWIWVSIRVNGHSLGPNFVVRHTEIFSVGIESLEASENSHLRRCIGQKILSE